MSAAMSSPTLLSLPDFAPDTRAWVVRAQQLADERGSAEVCGVHLLQSALNHDPGVVAVLQRAGVDVVELALVLERAIRSLAKSQDSAYLAPSFQDLLGDARVSSRVLSGGTTPSVQVETLLTTLVDHPTPELQPVLARFQLGRGSLTGFVSALRSVPRPQSAVVEPASLGATLRDLTALAKASQLEPVVGRDAEVEQVLVALLRKDQRHVLIVGEEGVGRGALARGAALSSTSGDYAEPFRFLELNSDELLEGVRSRAEAHLRFERLLALVSATQKTVLVIRALGRLLESGPFGPGLGSRLISAAQRVQLLVTASPQEHTLMRRDEPALAKIFSVVEIDEPSVEVAQEMVCSVAPTLERHHSLTISAEACAVAAQLAKRYLGEHHLPASAIDVLDSAAARRRLKHPATSDQPVLTSEDVAVTVAALTGVPVARLVEQEAAKLAQMEARLGERVVGQARAVAAISRAIRRSRVGLRDPRRPIGSFLFLGTSGVGKTELAKALAHFLFDDERALTRLDMSEFMERHMAQRLLGAPPGYADSEEGGFLTEAVRRRPYSVLLFDEVEKAHRDVFNLLLQVLDDGRLTDGRGRVADFTNTVVIMTSNIGSDAIAARASQGEGGAPSEDELMPALRAFFRPEFINRIGDVVVFSPLGRGDLAQILEIQLNAVRRMLAASELQLVVDDEAKAWLVQEAYEPELGARPLQRVLVRRLQDPLAQAVLSGHYAPGTSLRVTLDSGQLSFAPVPRPD